jgi:phospholipase C
VPLLLISPYARQHAIVHAVGNQASVVKFADLLFGLTPLARLPDEAGARALGKQRYHQDNLGPQDALTPDVTDLLGGFDAARLAGRKPPLSPAYAAIPDALLDTLPQQTGYGCKALGIVTVDRRLGIPNEIPKDFNPRPKTQPTEGKWL